MNTTALSDQKANEIGGAIQRIAELTDKKIIEASDAAEKRGLEQFLSRAMTEHAQELLACWFTMQRQYRPLIQGFVGLLANANAILDRAQPAAAPAPKQEEPVKQEEPAK